MAPTRDTRTYHSPADLLYTLYLCIIPSALSDKQRKSAEQGTMTAKAKNKTVT